MAGTTAILDATAGRIAVLSGQRASNRVVLINLETDERMEFALNPAELSENVGIEYDQPIVLGMSNKPLRYKATGPMVWDLELYAQTLIVGTVRNLDLEAAQERVEDMRRFLLSLTVPSTAYADFIGGAPPKVLFLWPGIAACEVRLTSGVKFAFDQFRPDLHMLAYKATLQLTEARDSRKWSDDVRVTGAEFMSRSGYEGTW